MRRPQLARRLRATSAAAMTVLAGAAGLPGWCSDGEQQQTVAQQTVTISTRSAGDTASPAPACPAPAVATTGWRAERTTDGRLEVLVPPTYWKDGRNDLWHDSAAAHSLRDFGVRHGLDDTPAAPLSFHDGWQLAEDASDNCRDCYVLTQHSTCREAVHGRIALIQTGRLSGGDRMGPMPDDYVVRARYELGGGRAATFHGRAWDRAGQEELLAAARTVRWLPQ